MTKYFHQVMPSAELGGGSLVGLEIASFLGREGRTAPVWIPGPGRTLDHARRHGLDARLYNGRALFARGLVRPLLANWGFGRTLGRESPGLVHVHETLAYGAMSWGLKRSGLARVVHVQIEGDEPGYRWAFKRPPDLIVTCARFLADIVRRGLPVPVRERQWIEAVPNAVNTERFFPGDRAKAKAHLNAPADRPLVLMLANLSPHKGQETAVRAVSLLKQQGIAIECWLAGVERGGTGLFTRRLRGLIEETGVGDRVRLLGFRDDAPDLLRAADFFLLPSMHEGLPLTVLEAQATRVPVLASATAGIPEVVSDGETGYLIAPNDAEGYAARIRILLEQPEVSRRIAERAYERTTREYNWKAYCARLWDYYQEVLARHESSLRRTTPDSRLLAPVP